MRRGKPGSGGLGLTREEGLEGDHAGVGEEQRRIAHRDQRAAGHAQVALALEIAEEGLSDLLAGHYTGRLGGHVQVHPMLILLFSRAIRRVLSGKSWC